MHALPTHRYIPEVFNELPDFFVAREKMAGVEKQINELGDVICSHGLYQTLGISLLHKHFDLSADERVVRRYRDHTFATMAAECDVEDELFPYLWCLSDRGSGFGFYPVEFCVLKTQLDRIRAKAHFEHMNNRRDFFADFAQALVAKGLEGILGLSALYARSYFCLEAGDTLLELSDVPRRILTLERKTEDHVKSIGDTTKTLWHFHPSKEQIEGAHCATHCYGHCNGHLERTVPD